jgi:pyruvate kinase
MIKIMKRTKIVATIGPSSSSKEVLKEMILAGLNVCRLNFSHGAYEDHAEVIENIRSLNDELGLNVAILADLQGPKIRTGEMQKSGVYWYKLILWKVQRKCFQLITLDFLKM